MSEDLNLYPKLSPDELLDDASNALTPRPMIQWAAEHIREGQNPRDVLQTLARVIGTHAAAAITLAEHPRRIAPEFCMTVSATAIEGVQAWTAAQEAQRLAEQKAKQEIEEAVR